MNEHAERVSGENAVIRSQWRASDRCASPPGPPSISARLTAYAVES